MDVVAEVGGGEQDWFLQVCRLICLNVLRSPEAFNDVLASPPTIVVEAAEGRLHSDGWRGQNIIECFGTS